MFVFFQRCTLRNKKITQSFLSTAKFITKYSSERLFSTCREKISNLIVGHIIDSNLTNVHKREAYTVLDFMKLDITKTKIKYNNYSRLPFEIQFLKAIKEDF